jgi:hypothetical protein
MRGPGAGLTDGTGVVVDANAGTLSANNRSSEEIAAFMNSSQCGSSSLHQAALGGTITLGRRHDCYIVVTGSE